MRYKEPGWVEAPLREADPSGRRSVWVRETPPLNADGVRLEKLTRLELCAGREGHDHYVCLTVGEELDSMQLYDLCQIAQYELSWMVESADARMWREAYEAAALALRSLTSSARESLDRDEPPDRPTVEAAEDVVKCIDDPTRELGSKV